MVMAQRFESHHIILSDLYWMIGKQMARVKAELLQEGIIFLNHLFARGVLGMKKLEIKKKKTKPTFMISVLKVEY